MLIDINSAEALLGYLDHSEKQNRFLSFYEQFLQNFTNNYLINSGNQKKYTNGLMVCQLSQKTKF